MLNKIADSDFITNADGSIYHLNLKPENISGKIIVVGDPGRVHRVSRFFSSVEFEMNKREFITHTGKYKNKRITVLSTGMGTDNIEIALHELDALVNVDLVKREFKSRKKKLRIVRVGTSGATRDDIRLGSHLASEYAIGLDSLMHFYDFKMKGKEKKVATELQKTLDLPYLPYCFKGDDSLLELFKDCTILGNTLTCPGFYAPQGRNVRIPTKYPDLIDKLLYFHEKGVWITNMEMETAGYYALCNLLGHEVISLNAIIANRSKKTVSKDPNKVIDALIRKVLDRI